MLRNKCTQLVRRAKLLYSLDSFGPCRTSGDFWKRLRLKSSPQDFNPYFVHTDIFNDSLSACFFPTSWKYAIVRPLAKCTSATVSDDFRSISILPALSKALEFLVHQQEYKYVNDNKLFDSYQSGFRKIT
ncbi:hypothetical protein PR048_000643 [Dryococelus australis]|uniref:Reverse transcriptase n=1 Tax=Dryococelus australis TaxID=614101 RepID=A0ABQ9IF81_9NEOP|nr:hypothetical protein PR048_000643 [Dryococelus australis]